MSNKKIIVKQTRSEIGRDDRVRDTLKALGLGRIGKEQTLPENDAIKGMIRKVQSLVEVRDAK